jgi:hypothetical protein
MGYPFNPAKRPRQLTTARVALALDGTLCEGCGAYIGPATGHARACPECATKRATITLPSQETNATVIKRLPYKCATCMNRYATADALVWHRLNRHKS